MTNKHIHIYAKATLAWNLAEALRDLAVSVEQKGETKAIAEIAFHEVPEDDLMVMVAEVVPSAA